MASFPVTLFAFCLSLSQYFLVSVSRPSHYMAQDWAPEFGDILTTKAIGVVEIENSKEDTGSPLSEILGREIQRKDLISVQLDYFKFNADNFHMITPKCRGGRCQDSLFETCQDLPSTVVSPSSSFSAASSLLSSSSSLALKSCWNDEMTNSEPKDTNPPINCPFIEPRPSPGVMPIFDSSCSREQDYFPHEKVAGQVYILHSVYINSRGNPFTSEYHFDRGGCANDGDYSYPPDTTVTVFKEIVNLVHWNAHAFYHGMVEILPAILLLADIFRKNPQIPVVQREGQSSFLTDVGLPLLGVQPDELNVFEIKDTELFFAEKVYQPFYANCGRPSLSQWQYLRSNFLLPSDGIPMLNPDWTLRYPHKISTARDGFPDDWIAVLGVRGWERSLPQSTEVESAMIELFGNERVKTFDGSVSILDARSLFKRVRIYVSPHGALMTNMVFMPFGGVVFEIRPNDSSNARFHHMAEASGHDYYLVLGEATKHKSLNANTTQLVDVLRTIAYSL